MSPLVRVVVVSEEARERRELMRVLDDLPGIEIVAEVDLVCQMGRQAGDVDADCVVLDIDRYPLAGTLPGTSIVILARAIHPRFLQFLKQSGASCCIDKGEPDWLAHLMSALFVILE